MTLKDRLSEDLRAAMRSGDEVRKVTLRSALAAIRNAEDAVARERLEREHPDWQTPDIDDRGPPDASELETVTPLKVELSDDHVLDVLRRQVKQRCDSVEAFQKANRQDLVDKESAEIAVLQGYLPQQMSRAEIADEARAVIAETGATGPADKGKVMPVLMKRLAGKAEGREINAVVTELLTPGGGV